MNTPSYFTITCNEFTLPWKFSTEADANHFLNTYVIPNEIEDNVQYTISAAYLSSDDHHLSISY